LFYKATDYVNLKSAIERKIVLDTRTRKNMTRIYKGQSSLRIEMKTFTDLTEATTVTIRYRKPDKSRGSFAAGIIDRAQGVIVHECANGEIDQAGWWRFWAAVTFSDGRSAPGSAVKVYVWREGR
jgi:hypothetical protein